MILSCEEGGRLIPRYFLGALLLLLLVAGCGTPRPAGQESEGTLSLVASTGIVADVVQQVAGPSIPVTALVPPGTDSHGFQPSPRDIATIEGADLLFINGLGLETTLQPLLDQTDPARVVDLSVGLEPLEAEHHAGEDSDHSAEHHAGEDSDHSADPHVWHDPTNVATWTEEIAEALAALDPANAERYRTNAEAYRTELSALDTWIASQIDRIPPERRLLVVDHETLTYYATRYDLTQIGTLVEGTTTVAEPSAQALARLQQRIESERVPAIFVSSSVNPAIARSLADDLGIDVVTLYTESLSPPDGPAATYLDSMRYNTEAIVDALR